MKILWLSLTILILCGCSPDNGEITADNIKWVYNYREGLRQAKTSGQAAMLFFTADWCPPCVELKKHVFTDARVVAASKPLVNILIDVDQHRQLMKKYRVRGIPAIFFLNANGDTVARFSGARNVKNFVKQMQAANNSQRVE